MQESKLSAFLCNLFPSTASNDTKNENIHLKTV